MLGMFLISSTLRFPARLSGTAPEVASQDLALECAEGIQTHSVKLLYKETLLRKIGFVMNKYCECMLIWIRVPFSEPYRVELVVAISRFAAVVCLLD